mgnify:CR=1 FL=1
MRVGGVRSWGMGVGVLVGLVLGGLVLGAWYFVRRRRLYKRDE